MTETSPEPELMTIETKWGPVTVDISKYRYIATQQEDYND